MIDHASAAPAAARLRTSRAGGALSIALLSSVSLLGLAQSANAQDGKGEIVVTAPRQEIKARAAQRNAPNLISVQSAETIAKYPDFNAAEALGRMPGISLSSDTGEGRFINIRGIDGNLDGATFGGVPLLNTYPGGTYFSGGGRAVEFDTIPTGSIDGLIVTYTGLPDHEAEGLGGSVDLTPRTATDVTKPFFDGALGYGYEPEHHHAGPSDIDVALGARFGFAGGHLVVEGEGAEPAPLVGWLSNPTPFSFVLTGSVQNDRRGFDDIEEDYNNPGTADRSYQDIQFRRYDYHRSRFGFGGEFDFKPNDDNQFYIRGNEAGYTEGVKKNRLTYDFSAYTQTPQATGFQSDADLSISSTDEQETHRNDVIVAGGLNRFDRFTLDYRVSYSRAAFDQPFNFGGGFTGPTAMVAYNNAGNNGDFPRIAVVDGTNINDPALYSVNDVNNSQEHDVDEEYAYAANLAFPVQLLNDQDQVKTGFEVRLRDKIERQFGEDPLNVGPLDTASLFSPAITDFYGQYTNGPNVNTNYLRAQAQAVEGPDQFQPSGFFKAREFIYAEYAQYQATVGKLGLLAGVRVETTSANYGNYDLDPNGNVLGYSENPQSYTNAFPTVQLRYEFTPKFLLRATYSTGIARPGFNQVAGAVTLDTSNGIITTGNPKLQPTTGDNFDLDFEYYLPQGGIVQFGAFDKEFSNYIVTESRTVASDPRLPSYIGPIKLVTYSNVSSAYARGVEASYHQQFQFLPDPFNGFGIESNVTLVDSRIEEYDASTATINNGGTPTPAQYGLLPGTSRVTFNLAGFYEAHGVEARISSEYVSRELFSLGGLKQDDTIQDDRLTLDWASAYAINDNYKIYFNVKNLTNEPLRFYIGNPSFPIQREFYEQTYEAGLKVRF